MTINIHGIFRSQVEYKSFCFIPSYSDFMYPLVPVVEILKNLGSASRGGGGGGGEGTQAFL